MRIKANLKVVQDKNVNFQFTALFVYYITALNSELNTVLTVLRSNNRDSIVFKFSLILLI